MPRFVIMTVRQIRKNPYFRACRWNSGEKNCEMPLPLPLFSPERFWEDSFALQRLNFLRFDYENFRPSVFTGLLRASISKPLQSHSYCCMVMSLASCSERGQQNRPCSNRLYSSKKPLLSQYRPLIRSVLLPQNRNSASSKASAETVPGRCRPAHQYPCEDP